MNYLAHGYRHIGRPYFLAGTAVPDWLSVLDRRVRARRRRAVQLVDDADPAMAAVASGIVQHHDDDDAFHRSAAFVELQLDFTIRIRDALPPDDSLRPGFLGHILVELLLDASLDRRRPGRLDAYYAALDRVDPAIVETAVGHVTARPPTQLSQWIRFFIKERFLADYTDDERLWTRLNQVMRRVRLPPIPFTLIELFPAARQAVDARLDDLLVNHHPTQPASFIESTNG